MTRSCLKSWKRISLSRTNSPDRWDSEKNAIAITEPNVLVRYQKMVLFVTSSRPEIAHEIGPILAWATPFTTRLGSER